MPAPITIDAYQVLLSTDVSSSIGVSLFIPASTGGIEDGSFLFRMRGFDQTLSNTVYWDSAVVDATASDYSGPGPIVSISVVGRSPV